MEIIGKTIVKIGKMINKKIESIKYFILITLNKNNLCSLNKKYYIKVR